MKMTRLTQLATLYIVKQPLSISLGILTLSFGFMMCFNGYVSKLETLGDGMHYMRMYHGDLAKSPFGYRILTPYLANLLPWNAEISFKIVTYFSLGLTSVFLYVYSRKIQLPLKFAIGMILIWFFSYPFIYNSVSSVRVDPPMLMLIVAIILASKYSFSYLSHVVLICIGVLFHEMVLIVIPALWLDKIFGGNLTGGLFYKYWELMLISLIPLVFLFLSRNYIEVLPTDGMSYIDTPFRMINFVLAKSGGEIMHILRLYVSYGPIIIYGFFFMLFQRKIVAILPFCLLLILVIIATLFAVDTLRVMSIINLPVLLYGVRYLNVVWSSGFKFLASLAFGLQIIFSFVVYVNFASFEGSTALLPTAILVSVASLVTCLIVSCFMYLRVG